MNISKSLNCVQFTVEWSIGQPIYFSSGLGNLKEFYMDDKIVRVRENGSIIIKNCKSFAESERCVKSLFREDFWHKKLRIVKVLYVNAESVAPSEFDVKNFVGDRDLYDEAFHYIYCDKQKSVYYLPRTRQLLIIGGKSLHDCDLTYRKILRINSQRSKPIPQLQNNCQDDNINS